MIRICLLLCLISNAYAINVESYSKDPRPIAGTAPRTEIEFKMAFELPKGFYIKNLTRKIDAKLGELVDNDSFEFSKFIKNTYRKDIGFRNFVFVDYYFDTPELNLFKTSSDYRLRYRWGHQDRYIGFLFLPFLKFFWPIRCEIQHKNGYQFDKRYNVVKVNESRFEFRNESHPFSDDNPAPGPPWPVKEYIKHAISGSFKENRINVMDLMFKHLESKGKLTKDVDLVPILKSVTTRYRTHLHIDNPWGSGPNPTQSFIITLDKSEFEVMNIEDKRTEKKTFLEIEIEMERNITTEMETMMKLDLGAIKEYLGVDSEFVTAQSYSKEAYLKLQKDLIILRNELSTIISDYLKTPAMPLDFKYARFVKSAFGVSK